MEPMLSFLVEERMHTLRRDGALACRSRAARPSAPADRHLDIPC